MKKITKASAIFVSIVCIFLSGCGSGQLASSTNTPFPTITSTPTLIPTIPPTDTPTITPTPIGGGSGTIIFSEGGTLYSIDTNKASKKLIEENCSWNITFSPDGRYMTCSKYRDIDEQRHGAFGVILIELKTHKVVKRLIESSLIGQEFSNDFIIKGSPYYDFYYWSPDSQKFAFVGTHQDKNGLFVLDIETSQVTLLHESPYLYYPVWSPGSTKIMFFDMLQATHWGNNSIYVVNVDGTHLTKLTKKLASYSSFLSEWGKDDNTLYLHSYEFNGSVYNSQHNEIDLETMERIGPHYPSPDPANVVIPSPNHQHELIVRNVDEGIYLKSQDNPEELDVMKYFELVRGSLAIDQFKWSPDSKTIAHYDPKEKAIVLFSVESLTLSVLAKVAQGNPDTPYFIGTFLWLPDGKHIIFVQGSDNHGYEIAISDLSGNVKVLYTAKYPVYIYVEPTIY